MRSLRSGRRGQSASEFILATFLIAICSIAMISLFGDTLRGALGLSANALDGNAESQMGGKSDRPSFNMIEDPGGGTPANQAPLQYAP